MAVRTITATLTACLLMVGTSASAQFGPTQARASTAGPSNVIKSKVARAPTVIERQTAWVQAAARSELTKVNFLPRTAPVTSTVQQAVTAYAPSSGFGYGYAREWTPDDCERSIRKAEKRYNLPPYLLAAIALTESGREGKPSPVAMNIGGRAYFAAGNEDMQNVVARNGGEGASIDVGCLQINLRWHASRFKDWRSLLVPAYNAEYAAMYISELYRRYGTWTGAVGAYHSRTQWRSANYACLVSRRWSQIFGSVRAGCGADIEAMARLMYNTQRG